MSDVVIRVEKLTKRYRLGHANGRASGDGLRHVIGDLSSLPLRTIRRAARSCFRSLSTGRVSPANGRSCGNMDLPTLGAEETSDNAKANLPVSENEKSSTEEFCALRNVSFDVRQGEVLGIIGRNGAGKSTLLKILSRITEPTRGRIGIKGRVASLLEVGTGFHPELTGRENIFLNGAILGMSQSEVRRKFDEIVDFAGVERFLDTPVKRYSSGMYVRLAFAVAAHLEPEILIVDEVLAVGDAEFQSKCLGKMEQVSSREGKTVLFVSHNMMAIQRLCSRGILLKEGSVFLNTQRIGDLLKSYSVSAVERYLNAKSNLGSKPCFIRVEVKAPVLRIDCDINIEMEWFLPETIPGVKVGIGVNTPDGQRIYDSLPEDRDMASPTGAGYHHAVVRIPNNALLEKHYNVSVGLWARSEVYEHLNPAVTFSVGALPNGPYKHESTREGLVQSPMIWTDLA